MGLAIACLMLPPTAIADEDNRRCSHATLKGDYGLSASGIRGIGPGVTEMFVLTGVRTYDGNGGFTTVSSIHGQMTGASRDLTATGTYQVNADCTGTATVVITGLAAPLVSSFVIVKRGKEIKEATMGPSTDLATATLTKQ